MGVHAIVLVSTAFRTNRFVNTVRGSDATCYVDPKHGTFRHLIARTENTHKNWQTHKTRSHNENYVSTQFMFVTGCFFFHVILYKKTKQTHTHTLEQMSPVHPPHHALYEKWPRNSLIFSLNFLSFLPVSNAGNFVNPFPTKHIHLLKISTHNITKDG